MTSFLVETTSSGLPSPVKNLPPLTIKPQTKPAERPTAPSNSKEVAGDLLAREEQQEQQQPAPKTPPSEMSWMSLAMEKTRSLHQLLTGRFSRDNGSTQQAAAAAAAAPPRTQEQTASQSEEQTQWKSLEDSSPQSCDALKAPQVTSPLSASSVQNESSSQPAQGSVPQSLAHFYLSSGQQQQQQSPPQGWRQHSGNSSTASAAPGVLDAPLGTSPPSVVQSESQASVLQEEAPPSSGARPVWTGLVSEKASFLESQSGPTTPPGGQEVSICAANGANRHCFPFVFHISLCGDSL